MLKIVVPLFALTMLSLIGCSRNSGSSQPESNPDLYVVDWPVEAKKETSNNSDLVNKIKNKEALSFNHLSYRLIKEHVRVDLQNYEPEEIEAETQKLHSKIQALFAAAKTVNPGKLKLSYEAEIEKTEKI